MPARRMRRSQLPIPLVTEADPNGTIPIQGLQRGVGLLLSHVLHPEPATRNRPRQIHPQELPNLDPTPLPRRERRARKQSRRRPKEGVDLFDLVLTARRSLLQLKVGAREITIPRNKDQTSKRLLLQRKGATSYLRFIESLPISRRLRRPIRLLHFRTLFQCPCQQRK